MQWSLSWISWFQERGIGVSRKNKWHRYKVKRKSSKLKYKYSLRNKKDVMLLIIALKIENRQDAEKILSQKESTSWILQEIINY